VSRPRRTLAGDLDDLRAALVALRAELLAALPGRTVKEKVETALDAVILLALFGTGLGILGAWVGWW
jgi:hypothetical protein